MALRDQHLTVMTWHMLKNVNTCNDNCRLTLLEDADFYSIGLYSCCWAVLNALGMQRFRDKDESVLLSDDELRRILVENCVDNLVVSVQHRLYNDDGVVAKDPIDLGPQLKEVLVWGMDCYTRRTIELVICDAFSNDEGADILPESNDDSSSFGCGSNCKTLLAAQDFIEKVLLPCMNMQEPANAHNMDHALDAIIKVFLFSHCLCMWSSCLKKVTLNSGLHLQCGVSKVRYRCSNRQACSRRRSLPDTSQGYWGDLHGS